jgi:excisionase family DNA binding protein
LRQEASVAPPEPPEDRTTAALGYDAAARRLGVSRRYLERLVAAGLIAHHHHGRRVTFLAEDLDQYAAGCRIPARSAS